MANNVPPMADMVMILKTNRLKVEKIVSVMKSARPGLIGYFLPVSGVL